MIPVAPRKTLSISPPVQLPGTGHTRTQFSYPVTGAVPEQNVPSQSYYQQPPHFQGYPGGPGNSGSSNNDAHLKGGLSAPPPAGGYPTSGHTPPGVGGPAPPQPQQQNSVMYMQPQHGQAPRFMRPTGTVQRGVAPAQQRPPLNMSQNPQYYPTTTMFMSHQTPFLTNPGQPSVIIQQGPPQHVPQQYPAQFGQRMTTPHQQYPLTSPQTAHALPQQQQAQYQQTSPAQPIPGNFPYQPNQHNNPTVDYTDMKLGVSTVMSVGTIGPQTIVFYAQPNQSQMQQQPPAVVHQTQGQRRSKTVLRIQDPETMEDKTDSILGAHPTSSTPNTSEGGTPGDQSEASSARATPQVTPPPATQNPSPGDNVVAQFQNQVAKAIKTTDGAGVGPSVAPVLTQKTSQALPVSMTAPLVVPVVPPPVVPHVYGGSAQRPVVVEMPPAELGTPPALPGAQPVYPEPEAAAAAGPVDTAEETGVAQPAGAEAAQAEVMDDGGKEGRKRISRKQKLKDLNEKGDRKAGSDMDAFNFERSQTEQPQAAGDDSEVPHAAEPAGVSEPAPTETSISDAAACDVAQPDPVTSGPAPADPPRDTGPPGPAEPSSDDRADQQEVAKVAARNEQNARSREPSVTAVSSQDASRNHVDAHVVDGEAENEVDSETENQTPVIKKDKIELKYAYREDQWSPINPEGKKAYDRTFLLQLQYAKESLEKPVDLPPLPEVILDKPRGGPSGANDPRMGSRPMPGSMLSGNYAMGNAPDFSPSFFRPSPSGRHSGPPGINRSRSQQKGGRPANTNKIIIINQQPEVKLHKAENAYKVGQVPVAAPSGGGETDAEDPTTRKTEEVLRSVRSILNKLTPQKFQVLVQKILALEINSEYRLKQTLDIIFEKAIDEPNFSVAYANLCKNMKQMNVNCDNPPENAPDQQVGFRKLLLNRCQREFEKEYLGDVDIEGREAAIRDCKDADQKKQLQEELDMDVNKSKRRTLGNIRFIGELYKLKMLTENIMHDCIMKLLKAADAESLECLCRLLTTIGKELDHEVAKQRMDQYFAKMEKIVQQKKKINSRVCFMLQDVLELRLNQWVPRREDNNPKTIDQIHKEVAQEARQREQLVQQLPHPSRMAPMPRGGPPRGRQGQDEQGWTSVGTKPQRIDPSKMKISKQSPVDEKITLGPSSGFGAWGRGASGGGSRTSSQENERPSTPSNRYAALGDQQRGSESRDGYDSRSRGAGRGLPPSRDKGGRQSLGNDRRSQGLRGYPVRQLSAERESAIQAVKDLSQPEAARPAASRTPGHSRNQSRDSSQSREREDAARMPPPAAPVSQSVTSSAQNAGGKQLSLADLEKKTRAIMDEFLHLQDSKEATECVMELQRQADLSAFVTCTINHVLERSAQARTQTGQLHHDLVKNKVLSQEQYTQGLNEVLETADDFEIDIPMIWTYLGELVAPMVTDSLLPMSFLRSLKCEKLRLLAAQLLLALIPLLGKIAVRELWSEGGMSWAEMMPQGTSPVTFLKDQKLDLIFCDGEPRSPTRRVSVGMGQIQEELDRLFLEKKASNEEVFDWISENVEESYIKDTRFVRGLMTAVARSVIEGAKGQLVVSETLIPKRKVLLIKYIDRNPEHELQALYALQALVHRLEHPSGMMLAFFDKLYDEDIVSEEAFNNWERSVDPAEQAGRAVAKESVVQFFTWLRNTEEEEVQ